MDKVFLLGCHKSGTSLLRSLFDGNDQFFTIPVESHFLSILDWWTEYPLRKKFPRDLTKTSFQENVLNWIKYSNNANDPLSDSVATGLFDEQLASHFIKSSLPLINTSNEQELIDLYFKTLLVSLNGSSDGFNNKIVVEKSVENFEHAIDIARIYPDSKFIHIIRNPYSNIVSLRKYKTLRGIYPEMERILRSISSSYYYLLKNSRNIKNYMTIRYEDLVSNTEEEVKKICSYLGIKFTDNLTQPTFRGNHWKGNSTSSVQFEGVGKNLDRWKGQISPFEMHLVNKYLSPAFATFDYQEHQVIGSPYRRNKGESLKNYVKNRILLGKIK